MSWSKDPNSGKPNFIPEDKLDDVDLYTVADLDQEAALKGIKSPGWVYYNQHERADGHIARRVETLVSFRGSYTMGSVEAYAPEVINSAQLSPQNPEIGTIVTIIPATFSGSPVPNISASLTKNGEPVSLENNQFLAEIGDYVLTHTATNSEGSISDILEFSISEESSQHHIPLDSLVLFNGHSLVDAIFGPMGMTFTPYREENLSVRWTIPGSPMSTRWEARFGAPGAEEPAPDAPAFDPSDHLTCLPGRDMGQFDAMLITEGGPFPQAPKADGGNDAFFFSQEYFNRWLNLAESNNVNTVYFWTIWPGVGTSEGDWETIRPGDDDSLPPFRAFLKSYNLAAETWCANNNVKIIPGHRLFDELYVRAENGQIPGATGIEDLLMDFIHPNYLGAVYIGVMVHRWMFGEFPSLSEIQSVIDGGENLLITPEHVIDVVSSTFDYVQGDGIGINYDFEPDGTEYFNYEMALSDQGFVTNIGSNTPAILAGAAMTNDIWAWKDVSGINSEFYAVIEIELDEAGADGADMALQIAGFATKQEDVWDGSIGLYYRSGMGLITGYDISGGWGTQFSNQNPDRPWETGLTLKLECIVTQEKIYFRNLAPDSWSGGAASANDPLPASMNTFVLGGSMADDTFTPNNRGFKIHKGIILNEIPDDSRRMEYQAWINGGHLT